LLRTIDSVSALTELGRERLSEHFFMREMLYSEVGNVHGVPNIPEDPELAVQVGRRLAAEVLEPVRAAFGHVSIRSAYRSPTLNEFCNQLYLAGDVACWCTSNKSNAAQHIWDRRDDRGYLGATATVVVPGYIDYFERTRDYRPLAWWVRDNVPAYAEMFFFKRLGAFNIQWYEGPSDKSIWYLEPPVRELMTKRGAPDFEGDHIQHYAHIIPGRVRKKETSRVYYWQI